MQFLLIIPYTGHLSWRFEGNDELTRPTGDRTLYIIGNGFDRHHGIRSGYEHFQKFVERHAPDVFKNVEAYLPAGDEWGDLEFALANLDMGNIISDLEHLMPSYGADDWSDAGHHDFQYEVERVAECLSTTLKRRFMDWIRQVPIPTLATARRSCVPSTRMPSS